MCRMPSTPLESSDQCRQNFERLHPTKVVVSVDKLVQRAKEKDHHVKKKGLFVQFETVQTRLIEKTVSVDKRLKRIVKLTKD